MDFSSKAPEEKVYLGFDFTKRLDVSETVATATFHNRTLNSVDHDSSAMVSGVAVINAGVVKVMVINGIAGNVYELSVLITTSGGRTLLAKSAYKVA